MVDKRKLHHRLVVLRRIKTWHLIALMILFAGLSAYLLRQNNLGMVERRDQVAQADKTSGDVKAALGDLQSYVSSHMNTSLGEGVFLEHSHKRAYDEAVQKAANAVNPNSRAYSNVETGCRQQYVQNGSFSTYIKCVENGLKALAPDTDPLASVKEPPVELYRYNFVSPAWSLDWTGLAVLATLLVVVLIVTRLVAYLVLKLVLKLSNKN